jgi:hypothetical protein
MSSDGKQPAGSPARSPFWSKSYAEFVLDKELMEAKGGGGGVLPPESKEGRTGGDATSGQAHDGAGDRRPERAAGRRDREQGKTQQEDMEAEIRETNALIRKRRRGGVGLLPMPLALLMCLMVSSVDGFTAYDCSNQSNVVEAYSLLEPDTCTNMGKDGRLRRLYTVRSSK